MAEVLPIRPLDSSRKRLRLKPILVDARRAAAMLGVGLRTLRTMDAAGRLPAPVRLSPGCVRWRLAELRDWAEANCPDRAEWIARKIILKHPYQR